VHCILASFVYKCIEMAETIDLRSVSKFDGSNFQAWKFQMKAIFIANGLTSVVNGTKTRSENNTTEWDKSNAKAMVIISSTMESSQLEYLLTCETATDMWTRLTTLHEQKSESNKLFLMTKFHDYKMAPNDSVAQHIAKVENMTRQLKDRRKSYRYNHNGQDSRKPPSKVQRIRHCVGQR